MAIAHFYHKNLDSILKLLKQLKCPNSSFGHTLMNKPPVRGFFIKEIKFKTHFYHPWPKHRQYVLFLTKVIIKLLTFRALIPKLPCQFLPPVLNLSICGGGTVGLTLSDR